MPPLSDKKKASNAKWDAAHLKRMSLAIPLDLYEKLQDYVSVTKETVNGFIKRAISETVDQETEARNTMYAHICTNEGGALALANLVMDDSELKPLLSNGGFITIISPSQIKFDFSADNRNRIEDILNSKRYKPHITICWYNLYRKGVTMNGLIW